MEQKQRKMGQNGEKIVNNMFQILHFRYGSDRDRDRDRDFRRRRRPLRPRYKVETAQFM